MAARGARAAKRFGAKLWTSSGGGFDDRVWQMPISEKARSVEAVQRKLRALSAVFLDPAATKHEKANAKRAQGTPRKAAQSGSNTRGGMDGHHVSVGPGC